MMPPLRQTLKLLFIVLLPPLFLSSSFQVSRLYYPIASQSATEVGSFLKHGTRFQSLAFECKKGISDDSEHKKSQSGEDTMLLKWFSNLCGGTYVELGALDGVRFSNSYLFHFTRDWKGVLIEIMPN